MSVINLSNEAARNKGFAQSVSEHSGQDLSRCYQCGKCSAGCPVAFAMDYRPNRIIRMLQLNMKDEVLNSRAIWLCATCATCTARCPRDVDLSRIMDTLRVMAMKQGKTQQAKPSVIFHEEFMKSMLRFGRLYELGLVFGLNLRTNLFNDVELGWPMVSKGKLSFLPHSIKGAKEVQDIMKRAERLEGESH